MSVLFFQQEKVAEPYLAVALAERISVNYLEFYGGNHTSVIGFALDHFH